MAHRPTRPGRASLAGVVVAALLAAAITPTAQAAAAAADPAKPSMAGARTGLGTSDPAAALPAQHTGAVSGEVIVTLDPGVSVTGTPVAGTRVAARLPMTDNATVNKAFSVAGAKSLQPLFSTQSGAGPADLSRTYVLQTGAQNATTVADALARVAGVESAEPDRYVNTMSTGGQAIPSSAVAAAAKAAKSAKAANTTAGHAATGSGTGTASGIPTNYALADSAQSFLNAGGVDAAGAYSILGSRYGQLPGSGETITNVSIGDLTDASMASNGDTYVQTNGPTTVLINGQRYLDEPSMPLIPAYVANPDGTLSGTESTENQDPTLGEILLDFGVMSPLPDGRQRAGSTGSGDTDLLGIAPGADYRLVVPQQPTTDEIAQALISAAQQNPRPNVINASLGFGTDAQGMPGRYLEDDPLIEAVVSTIVHQYGIVVTLAANDGTRLYTPTAVGPDGGSTPTDVARNEASATNINDDSMSTTPSQVPDSGAIAVGATTLDDTLADGTSGPATTAETRLDGSGEFSSGFGSRIDLSAPGDNILSFAHQEGGSAQDVEVTLEGGTSASAPEVAASAAVVLQAARLAGHRLDPQQVRSLLESTGRAVPTAAQIDEPLQVGPQVDVTAATEAALGLGDGSGNGQGRQSPSIVRLSVAHRTTIGGLGGEFLEETDPNYLDLGDEASGGDGEGLVGPVTFAGDVVGLPSGAPVQYALTVGDKVWKSSNPAIRVTPTQLLTAAKLPVVSTTDRTVQLTYSVMIGGHVLAKVQHTLTVGPSNGEYAEALAPVAPATASAGAPVTVRYSLANVAKLSDPELVVSTAGHWSPLAGPIFTAAWSTPLTATSGSVTIPASAFDDGGAIYGIGILQSSVSGAPQADVYGEFTPIRIVGGSATKRPQAPTFSVAGSGAEHSAEITRAAPTFGLSYSVRGIRGASSAEVEFSAPAPTSFGSYNTFTNANGTRLDDDGVDGPSTAHASLHGQSGTVQLNALSLGLSTSEIYDVRILALDDHGDVVGQASPLSTLEIDDGLAPNGATVSTFAAAGANSLVALNNSDGSTEIVHYNTGTGAYGAVLASDAGADSDYEVVGIDPTDHRALLAHESTTDADIQLETWNTATNTLVGSVPVSSADYSEVAGQVDPTRDRGAVLLRAHASGFVDEVLSIDLATGTAAAPIPANPSGVPQGDYGLLTIDPTNGDAYLGKVGFSICFGGVEVSQVDLATGVESADGDTSGCSRDVVSEGGTLYNLVASSFSVNIVPTGVIDSLNEATGTSGTAITLRQQLPIAFAVDPVNGLAVVSYQEPAGTPYFGSSQGLISDNNATGQLAVVNLSTGKIVDTLVGFQVTPHGGPLANDGHADSIQLDPATRTGWTYGPGGQQVQQFSY